MESERSYSAVNYSARSLKITGVSDEGYSKGGTRLTGGGLKYGSGTGFHGTLSGKYGGSVEAQESGTSYASTKDIMRDMMFGKRIPDSAEEAGDVNDLYADAGSVNGPGKAARGLDERNDAAWENVRTDIYAGKMSVLYIFSILFEDFRSRIDEMMAGLRREYEGVSGDSAGSYRNRISTPADTGGIPDAYRMNYSGTVFRAELTQENYYREEETTSFRAHGKARCSDGREIDFDINVGMSRSFEKMSKKMLNFDPANCIDPLVINLNEGVASVSDRYIYFDLDGDGEEERIKSLSENSGYLALDKNGDGIINDGTELLGTASGDGFTELAAYDSDGDGWIDEDDEIFDKLKVWIRNEDGTDTLLSFKDAGVGAINLANSRTEYSIKDKNNRSDAIIRSTGMFLYEDGRTGTVQQVDMVS